MTTYQENYDAIAQTHVACRTELNVVVRKP